MAALALYVAVAAALLFAWQRFVKTSRAAALALLLLPMLFTGRALLTNRVYAPIDLPFQYAPLASHAAQFGIGKPHEIALSDLAIQIIPWQQALRFALRNGEWPLGIRSSSAAMCWPRRRSRRCTTPSRSSLF